MDQIWIDYLDRKTGKMHTKRFWYADLARRFIQYINGSDNLEIIAQGGYENAEELCYANGWD